MVIWSMALKELRLLVRDRLALVILLALPLLFIFILGTLLGENFGEKPDDRLRVSLVDLDHGSGLNEGEPWSKVVQRDLAETAGIRVEILDNEEQARQLIAEHRRAAVLVFDASFTEQINRCSFLADGLNPFYRDGVYLDKVDVQYLKDAKQPGASAIIEQVVQVSLLRVILPWMIGRAFERLSDPSFIELLGKEVSLPVPLAYRPLIGFKDRITLGEMLSLAARSNASEYHYRRTLGAATGTPALLVPEAVTALEYRTKVGSGVQAALRKQFSKYNLRGRTWADLTKSLAKEGAGAEATTYVNRDGSGVFSRGAQRYQILVPSYTVMFAFFLVMIVGWVFVAERRQGTLKRLRAAPITRSQIVLGKLLPYFLVSLAQGVLLLLAGRLVFGMRWGPADWPLTEQLAWLLPVLLSTSLAAMGMALLVAAVARSEIQVALYGAVPVLVLALIGGCVLPREMMPEQAQQLTLLTPQGWALDAYRELLDPNPTYQPNLAIVTRACGVLSVFGLAFLGLAWGLLRLD